MPLRRLAPLLAVTLLLAPASQAAAQEPTPLVVVEVASVPAVPDTATVAAEISRTARAAAGGAPRRGGPARCRRARRPARGRADQVGGQFPHQAARPRPPSRFDHAGGPDDRPRQAPADPRGVR